MKIVKFKKHHLEIIKLLHITNGDSGEWIELSSLPSTGFIAYDKQTPIAAGFLRKVEPCFAQIDTLVTNKDMSKELRHEGISLVVEILINEAQYRGLKGLICHTRDDGILKRAESLGFRQDDQKIIVKLFNT